MHAEPPTNDSAATGFMMATANIDLSEQQTQALRELAHRTGRSEGELLRDAVTQYLSRAPSVDRLALLRQARGLWKDRTDLPDLTALRAEWDRLSS